MDRKTVDWMLAIGFTGLLSLLAAIVLQIDDAKRLVASWREGLERHPAAPDRAGPSPMASSAPRPAEVPAQRPEDIPAPTSVLAPPDVVPADQLAAAPQPRTSMLTWITPDDYPAEALRNEWKGRVTAAWVVEKDGRVSRCRIVASSGHESLDAATCRLIMLRGAYLPARDKAMNPVAADTHQSWA
jgi:protein TonB